MAGSVQELLVWKGGYATGVAEIDEQHRAFSSKVVAFRDGLKSATPIAPADHLLAFLNKWLVDHILNTDKRFGSFILTKRAA